MRLLKTYLTGSGAGYKGVFIPVVVCILCLALMPSCSSRKFLKEGETVLSDVKLTSTDKQLNPGSYRNFVRQEPNARWFTLFKVPLGIYCMSKADSIKGNKGLSKIWKKIGEAPVIYNEDQTRYCMRSLEQALNSEGYLHAEVDTAITRKEHKTQLEYRLKPGQRHYVSDVDFRFDDHSIQRAFQADSSATLLKRGMPLNLNRLSEERSRIIHALHNRGYYYLNNDFVTFDIDTMAGSLNAAVTMTMNMPAQVDSTRVYTPQRFRHITLNGAYSDSGNLPATDTINYKGISFIYKGKPNVNKRMLLSHLGIGADSLYKERDIQNTYSNLNALPVINFTTIRIKPADEPDKLDCDINLRQNKPHTIGMEIEGTNTSGDLGTAVALTFSNRNLFRGSEQLSMKLRGAYEAITGLEGYSNQNYTEISAEANLRFPTLLLPFVSLDKKRSLKANSEAKIMYDTQDRPEFHRRILTAAWAYNWSKPGSPNWLHRYDLLSINYIYMPWISDTFRKEYLEGDDPHYSVLRYSYENLFIMKTSYGLVYNSLRKSANQPTDLYQTNGFQIKCNFEMAGNLLYGLAKATHDKKPEDGTYKIFGIGFSQYVKFDFDFAKSVVLNETNSLAFHFDFGIGIPYGNSSILPYEKRYFAGGANSVRGWSVRELGPGSYRGKDGKIDFVNQTGNLKLNLSLEWRTHLFWKLHGAFFLDAGNIWNTREYPDMEGAQFKINKFYKQIAASYGLGIRLNFDYFILRLDGGMKAINPTVPSGRLHYPITRPNFKRDLALHFAVGLPF